MTWWQGPTNILNLRINYVTKVSQ
jgi:hypothetical protein